MQEMRDLAFKIQTATKGLAGPEIPKKIVNELANSKSAMDLLLYCADNYLERGLSMVCDFNPTPVFS